MHKHEIFFSEEELMLAVLLIARHDPEKHVSPEVKALIYKCRSTMEE